MHARKTPQGCSFDPPEVFLVKVLFRYAPLVLQERPLHNPPLPEERGETSHLGGNGMQEAKLDSEDEAVTSVKTFYVDG